MSLNTQLLEYIETAKSTAQPEAFSPNYLIPGLLGEVGEIFGQMAKGYWHGWDEEKLKAELVAEYGDVCWMTALLIYTNMSVEDLDIQVTEIPEGWDPALGMTYVNRAVQDYHETTIALEHARETALRYLDEVPDAQGTREFAVLDQRVEEGLALEEQDLMGLWATLYSFSETVTGSDFQAVLDYNAKKLASRAARGVLRGSGDHR